MKWTQTLRISFGLTSLTVSILLAGLALGLFPDSVAATLGGRKALCEAVAIHCSAAVQRGDVQDVQDTTRALIERNPDILSAGVRLADGKLVTEVGDHEANWEKLHDGVSTTTQVQVPIVDQTAPWGQVEFRFRPLAPAMCWAILQNPIADLLLFVVLAGLLAYFLYLRILGRFLQAGSSAAAPQRVREALNTLAEGVLILDQKQRIAMANEAFARLVGRTATELEGHNAAAFPWQAKDGGATPPVFPWNRAAAERATLTGSILDLAGEAGARILSVNATPILGDDGSLRGTLATFDDLTVIERKNANLQKMLVRLRQSQAEVRLQNEKLSALASRDPLTNCYNRRAFFDQFENLWSSAKRYGHPLSCVMVDVDHFKKINDRFGHGVGDQVLQQIAQILRNMARQNDILCRYGGEEFCVLLPHVSLADAYQAAERFRQGIAAGKCGNVSVTASLGVSSLSLGASEPRELLDQADKALYHAKNSGRNRSICWDDIPETPAAPAPRTEEVKPSDGPIPIPFHAVTALVSALAHRHADTAHHSRRVADLAVALANGLMSQTDCYVLEVAALLHDIGKLGVPDAVLLKPGPLTSDEWKVIRTHEGIGEQIVAAAFTSPQLTAMIGLHHCWYGGSPHDSGLPRGQDIPLGARILSICDAYDAMVSDRGYRRGRSRSDAFAELRRCAGTQFDPELVERFIEIMQARDDSRTPPSLAMSKQIALKIGLEMEWLASAIDSRDRITLAARAGRLHTTAQAHGITPIAMAAAQLERCAGGTQDWAEFTKLTIQLMDLCRETYRSYLPAPATNAQKTEQATAAG
jgi:diguanylate cyclase (GGDEF)-like protein/PAS domain S-box-containing protein